KETSEQELRIWASQHLNVQIGMALAAAGWAGAEFWERRAVKALTLESLMERSEVCTVGIDGGGLDDLLGLVVLGRERGTRRWLWWARAWAHRIVLERRKEIAEKLLDLERAGDLSVVDVPGDDVEDLADIVCRVKDRGRLPAKNAIGVDPAGIGAIVDELTTEGRGIAIGPV